MYRILLACCLFLFYGLNSIAQKPPVKKPLEKRVKVYYEPTQDSSFLVWHDSFKEDRFLETMGKVVTMFFVWRDN